MLQRKGDLTRRCRASTTALAAIFRSLALFCGTPSISDLYGVTSNVALVAPLYITNDRFCSTLTLMNKSHDALEVVITFDSLEGEETARKRAYLQPHSSVRVELDSVLMAPHRFPELGSISVISGSSGEGSLTGRVTIESRDKMEKAHVEEILQGPNQYLGALHVGYVSGSVSIPVLAIHNPDVLLRRISVVCSDGAGERYDSEFALPAHTTFLINACIRRRSESRTYRELLTGEIGPLKKNMTILIKTEDQESGVSVWGFSTSKVATNLGLEITGIEFATSVGPGSISPVSGTPPIP